MFLFCVPTYTATSVAQNSDSQARACGTVSLLTSGRVLHLSALLILYYKRYREKGNKAGAIKGYQLLEQEGLGKLIEMKPQRGTSVVCPYLLTYNTQCVLESYACMVSVFLVVCTKACTICWYIGHKWHATCATRTSV